ncbi:single-stranded-DNA-specific exonuclease RecJ [Lentisphaerota bacterium ZTH]|nr:single-stranded-DNA-specific exonuclease RecJ [Lentisphaerota bacterium]WET07293.1 single-stranded-DNA-specific exonuclease RecJ [Lentisphaerota bacterium ZTH]
MARKKWRSACLNLENKIDAFVRKYSFPRPVAMYFASRGIEGSKVADFLNPRLAGLSDPYRFPGIKVAAKRLWDAVMSREPVLIHGDYDTDGITATALLSLVLRQNGCNVHSFIPHRFDDGYGFTPESLHKATSSMPQPCKVLVTVDCGITSCEAVTEANKMGIDTIITDHHEAGPELPEALSIVNPKVNDELEDLQVLAGAGVAFKLCHAFIKYGRQENLGGFTTRLEEVLDFVALGTVADIVPLLGENRILVKYGIEVLRKQFRPGIRALIESSKIKTELKPSDITFKLAPRINAAGRVGDANTALDLLESDNIVEAYKFSAHLEEFNAIRQQKEQEIYQEAREQIETSIDLDKRYSILVAGEDWHQGVIGIVASRIARDYNRPTIVLTIKDGKAYGSGRSVGTLNLVEVLYKSSDLLERFGGHPMAVGIGMKAEVIEEFYSSMEVSIKEQLSDADLEDYTSFDGEVQLEELDDDFFKYLKHLGPFGHSNPKPVYRFNDLELVKSFPIGKRHTRGVLRNRSNHQIEFIAFNFEHSKFQNSAMDILAMPQVNTYYNLERPQLQIIDLQALY